MLRRHAYVSGVVAGALVSGMVIAGLLFGGVLDTSAINVDPGPLLRAWDKNGARDSDSWTEIAPSSNPYRFDSVRDVHLETELLVIDYRGSSRNPGLFEARETYGELDEQSALPKLPSPAESLDPGPATLFLPSNQAARLAFSYRGIQGSLYLFTRHHGYRLTMRRAGSAVERPLELPLGTFSSPFVVTDGRRVLGSSLARSDQTISLSPARSYALRWGAPELSPFVMTLHEAVLTLRKDPSGYQYEASVAAPPGARTLDVFVGGMSAGVDPPVLGGGGPAPPIVRVRDPGSYLRMTPAAGSWQLKRRTLQRSRERVEVKAARMVAFVLMDGPSISFNRLTGEGLGYLQLR
jgi:hypothetical protein